MSAPLTRRELETMRCACGKPTCDVNSKPSSLRATCHPDAPFRLWYSTDDGTLIYACATCGNGHRIQVASVVPS